MPQDWYAFEAASWVLAGQHLSAEQRRMRWLEPLPAVELADRLARLALFADTTVDELFRIARSGRQVRYEPGRRIYEAGQRAADLQFLLDGRITLVSTDGDDLAGHGEEVVGPASFGFDEVFEGVPHRATASSTGITVVLSMLHDHFLGLLSENTELAQGVFRTLLDPSDRQASAFVVREAVRPPMVARPGDGLQMVEKMLVLAEMQVFSGASSDQLAALAGITREVTLVVGEVLVGAGDAPAIHILLAGEVAVAPVDGGLPLAAGAGDCTGLYETLGGREQTGWRGHVTRGGVALRIEREALFDLLADQVDLLQGCFGALQRQAATHASRVPLGASGASFTARVSISSHGVPIASSVARNSIPNTKPRRQKSLRAMNPQP